MCSTVKRHLQCSLLSRYEWVRGVWLMKSLFKTVCSFLVYDWCKGEKWRNLGNISYNLLSESQSQAACHLEKIILLTVGKVSEKGIASICVMTLEVSRASLSASMLLAFYAELNTKSFFFTALFSFSKTIIPSPSLERKSCNQDHWNKTPTRMRQINGVFWRRNARTLPTRRTTTHRRKARHIDCSQWKTPRSVHQQCC